MRIGLRGISGSGKSTVAAIISELTGWPVVKNIQDMVDGLALMGITKEHTPELYHPLAAEIGIRTRKYDPDWWVKRRSKAEACVFDDVRFENENCDVSTFYLVPDGWEVRDRPGLPKDAETEEFNRTLPNPGMCVNNPVDNPQAAAEDILRRCGWESPIDRRCKFYGGLHDGKEILINDEHNTLRVTSNQTCGELVYVRTAKCRFDLEIFS